ncbi:MAG TPA: hypothetical protein VMT37_06125 [Solirubrobacterales bacterium]|nr:hypothetical protein [Solirubrobacterales bacterium]
MKRFQARLTYANAISTLCLFLVLGGGAYAATQLPKNSVGSKQLKKNAVTTAKIKKEAVTGAKIKLSSLGAVPAARSAESATVASGLSAPEAVHVVGAPGEPGFENGFRAVALQGAGFYKDHDCTVHLSGTIEGESQKIAFTLPAADRPAAEFIQTILAAPTAIGWLEIFPEYQGADPGIVVPYAAGGGKHVFALDGISFRAATC